MLISTKPSLPGHVHGCNDSLVAGLRISDNRHPLCASTCGISLLIAERNVAG